MTKTRTGLLAFLATAIMLLAMAVSAAPALAADNLTITVNNAQPGQTYTLYKLFDATVTNERAAQTDAGNGSEVTTDGINYTLPTGKDLNKTSWDVNGTTETTSPGSTWFQVDSANNVSKATDNIDLTTPAFRNWAVHFGDKVGDSQTVEENATGDQTVTFSNLSDGYYFVTSTMGSLVTVTSVAPNAIVKDKNSAPSVSKIEDVKTSSVGDTVTYTVHVSLPKATNNVKFHDSLSDGLQLQGDGSRTSGFGIQLEANADEGARVLRPNRDYTVDHWSNTKEGGDNITITFNESYLSGLNDQVVLTFKYTAKLSAAAGINMKNEAYLTYGSNNTESAHQTVYESTFAFTVNKLDGQSNLNGAKFALSRNGQLGNLTESNIGDHAGDLLYFASDGTYDPDKANTSNYLRTANNSLAYKGLNNDESVNDSNTQIVYYLYEVTAPDGYNKLTAPVEVRINPTFATGDENAQTRVMNFGVKYNVPAASNSISNTASDNDATLADKSTVASNNNDPHNIWIVNNKGSFLPATGGMGTTLIYVIGAALVIAAIAALVVRKRRSQQ